MASSWGTIENACPQCGGDAKWYIYGDDCRGNRGSSGVNCVESCYWSDKQVKAFWSDLSEKRKQDYERLARKGVYD